jgi:hypothetical protein
VGDIKTQVVALENGGVEVSLTSVQVDHHSLCAFYSRVVFRADAQRHTSFEAQELCATPAYPKGGKPSCECGIR